MAYIMIMIFSVNGIYQQMSYLSSRSMHTFNDGERVCTISTYSWINIHYINLIKLLFHCNKKMKNVSPSNSCHKWHMLHIQVQVTMMENTEHMYTCDCVPLFPPTTTKIPCAYTWTWKKATLDLLSDAILSLRTNAGETHHQALATLTLMYDSGPTGSAH